MSVTKPIRKNRYKKDKKAQKASAGGNLGAWVKAVLVGAGFCLTGMIFIFGYDALTQCDYFRADAITVEGVSRLSEKAILEAAELDPGDNILSVNLAVVRKRLVAEPWIKSADIRRELPSRLIIRIDEHKPLAVLDVGRCFLIDTAGEIFKEADPSEMSDIPIIAGIDYVDWKCPENPETKIYSAVMAVLETLEMYRNVFPGQAVEEVHVDREMGLTLRARGPVATIHLGYGQYPRKVRRVGRIFTHLQINDSIAGIKSLDAHNPDRIVATPANRDTIEEEKEA